MFFENDGSGHFTDASAALPNTTASGSCVVAADWDKDGDLDLFVGGRTKPHRYPLAERSYLLRNDSDPKLHTLKFTDITTQLCPALLKPGMVSAALWTDYNNDSFPDLLLAGEFMPLQLYTNNGAKSFEQANVPAFSKTHGWYNSLTAGDFDNDGDMDYVAGNLGLNSWYKASEQEPVTVRYNDFNNDGALDAFLFRYNNGREYFSQPRNTVVEQIASLKKKIYYYADFGRMGYTDVFSESERNGTQELQAFQMASLYIENKGNGVFSIKPLPVLAQVAPLFGAVPLDVEGDGNLDLVAVGNSYAPEALTGRYDATIGWVLKGDGAGHFTPLAPQASGFAVRGDGKALVKLARGNSCLLVAGCNSGSLKAYQSMGVSKNIALHRNDVYALYTLANSKKRKEEFYYGATYLAQSGRFVTLDQSVTQVALVSANGSLRVYNR
jgi:hypothetical protein